MEPNIFYFCLVCNKNMRIFFCYISLLVVLSSCKKEPVPCIEIDTEAASVSSAVTFTSCSEKTLSQEWFMAGPENAPENSIGWSDIQFTHTFTIPGSYTITLNAYDNFSFLGEMKTTTKTIQVN